MNILNLVLTVLSIIITLISICISIKTINTCNKVINNVTNNNNINTKSNINNQNVTQAHVINNGIGVADTEHIVNKAINDNLGKIPLLDKDPDPKSVPDGYAYMYMLKDKINEKHK